MPKSAQNQPERKTKTGQDVVAGVKSGSHVSVEPKSDDGRMSTEKKCPTSGGDDDDERNVKVEYLDTPVKSENDKKEYRLEKLLQLCTCTYIHMFFFFHCDSVRVHFGTRKVANASIFIGILAISLCDCQISESSGCAML